MSTGETKNKTLTVFTYGTLKNGETLHHNLNEEHSDVKFLGTATLKGFKLYQSGIGKFPFIREGDGLIHGELYEISTLRGQLLDYVENYPLLYDKKTVEVKCNGKKILALVYYVGDKQLTHHIVTPTPIRSGRW